jgi:hypothetical protein
MRSGFVEITSTTDTIRTIKSAYSTSSLSSSSTRPRLRGELLGEINSMNVATPSNSIEGEGSFYWKRTVGGYCRPDFAGVYCIDLP